MIFLLNFLALAVFCVPVALAFYLGLRLVRALEMRRSATLHLRDLVAQVRAMRDHNTLLASELVELGRLESATAPHPAGAATHPRSGGA